MRVAWTRELYFFLFLFDTWLDMFMECFSLKKMKNIHVCACDWCTFIVLFFGKKFLRKNITKIPRMDNKYMMNRTETLTIIDYWYVQFLLFLIYNWKGINSSTVAEYHKLIKKIPPKTPLIKKRACLIIVGLINTFWSSSN